MAIAKYDAITRPSLHKCPLQKYMAIAKYDAIARPSLHKHAFPLDQCKMARASEYNGLGHALLVVSVDKIYGHCEVQCHHAPIVA